MLNIRFCYLAAAFFFLLFLVSYGSAANCGGATDCNCGDTLTSSWTMPGDLNCMDSGNHGSDFSRKVLIVDANSIILDCAGYSILGYDYNSILIDMNSGGGTRSNITIKNCNLTHSGDGIKLVGSSSVRHEDLNIADTNITDINGMGNTVVSGYGIYLDYVDKVNISDLNIFDVNVDTEKYCVIDIFRSSDVNVSGIILYNTSAEGLCIHDSNYFIFQDSNIWNIGIYSGLIDGAGIWLDTADHGIVRRNITHDCAHHGITLFGLAGDEYGTDVNILDNNIYGAGNQQTLDLQKYTYVLVEGNDISGDGNTFSGWNSGGRDCIGTNGGDVNNLIIRNNTIHDCKEDGSAISLDASGGSYFTQVYDNNIYSVNRAFRAFTNNLSIHDNNLDNVDRFYEEWSSYSATDINIYNMNATLNTSGFSTQKGDINNVNIYDLNLVILSSNDAVNLTPSSTRWGNVTIRDCIFSTPADGISLLNVDDVNIYNVFIHNNTDQDGIDIKTGNRINIQNVDINNGGQFGLDFNNLTDLNIFDTNINYSQCGMRLKYISDANIQNVLIKDMVRGNCNGIELTDSNNISISNSDVNNIQSKEAVKIVDSNFVSFIYNRVSNNPDANNSLFVQGTTSDNNYSYNYWGFRCSTDGNFYGITYPDNLNPIYLDADYTSTVTLADGGDGFPDNDVCWILSAPTDINIYAPTNASYASGASVDYNCWATYAGGGTLVYDVNLMYDGNNSLAAVLETGGDGYGTLDSTLYEDTTYTFDCNARESDTPEKYSIDFNNEGYSFTIANADADVNLYGFKGFTFYPNQVYIDGTFFMAHSPTRDTELNGDSNITMIIRVLDPRNEDLNLQIEVYIPDDDENISADFNENLIWGSLKNSGFCEDTDFTNWTDCNVPVSIPSSDSIMDDMNVLFYPIICNTQNCAGDLADSNVSIDKTNPIATIRDLNWNWQTPDVNVIIDATDILGSKSSFFSDLNLIKYRVDSDGGLTVNYGAWTYVTDSNVVNFSLVTDGNWAIQFEVDDRAGNADDVNTVYLLINTPPDVNMYKYTGLGISGQWYDGDPLLPPYSRAYDTSTNSDANVLFIIQVRDLTNTDLNLSTIARDVIGDTNYVVAVAYASLKNSGFCEDTNFMDWTDCNIQITVSEYDFNWQILFTVGDDLYSVAAEPVSTILFDADNPFVYIADFNYSWQTGDANIILDANDQINMTAGDKTYSDTNRISYRLDSDSSDSISFGTWQTAEDTNIFSFAVTGDGNFAIDFNAQDNAGNTTDANRLYVLIDSTVPTVSITSPTASQTITTSTVTLQYSGSDANSGVSVYWVSSDGSAWINNGTNVAYNFTGQSAGSNTYYVKAMDSADNNSTAASVTVTISLSSDGGSSYHACAYYTGEDICTSEEYCPGSWLNASDTTMCCSTECLPLGDTPPEPPVEPEIKVETFDQEDTFIVLDEEDIGNTAVNDLGMEQFPTKRLALSSELLVVRHVSGKITKQEGKVTSTTWTFRINVKNMSWMPFTNISIIEKIPKEVAGHVSKVSFAQTPEIKKADPIVEWTIDTLGIGEDVNLLYSVDSLEDESILEELSIFFSSLASPTALVDETDADKDVCKDVVCEDSNPCTEDYCIKGKCYHSSRNGLSCGEGLVCEETVCVATSVEPPEEKIDWTLPIVLLAIVAVMIIVFFVYRKKSSYKSSS